MKNGANRGRHCLILTPNELSFRTPHSGANTDREIYYNLLCAINFFIFFFHLFICLGHKGPETGKQTQTHRPQTG